MESNQNILANSEKLANIKFSVIQDFSHFSVISDMLSTFLRSYRIEFNGMAKVNRAMQSAKCENVPRCNRTRNVKHNEAFIVNVLNFSEHKCGNWQGL